MKKLLFLVLTASVAVIAFGAISGSAHDFRTLAWNDGGGASAEICKACHTPHNAQTLSTAPLWNHTVTTATFQVYAGYDMDSTPANPPTGASILCLSCHDGTVALDAFGGNSVSPGTMITGNALVGNDLRNDHPVSIDYTTAVATDTELRATTYVTSLGGTIANDLLESGTMVQCSSCHDVHNTVSASNSSLLRISNSGSALCLTCHDK